jgi:hypothetical protein
MFRVFRYFIVGMVLGILIAPRPGAQTRQELLNSLFGGKEGPWRGAHTHVAGTI